MICLVCVINVTEGLNNTAVFNGKRFKPRNIVSMSFVFPPGRVVLLRVQ